MFVAGHPSAPSAQAGSADLVSVCVRRGVEAVEPLLKIVDGKGWIAGGYARWCCSPTESSVKPGDIDVFVSHPLDVMDLTDELVSLGARVTKDVSFFVQLDAEKVFPGLLPIQLVKPQIRPDGSRSWGPTKDDVVRQINMSVCRVALDGHGYTTATADPHFEEDEAKKRIRFKRIKNPAAEMRHAFKYAAKGYKLTREDALEILDDWAQRDPAQRAELKAGYGGPEVERDIYEGYR